MENKKWKLSLEKSCRLPNCKHESLDWKKIETFKDKNKKFNNI